MPINRSEFESGIVDASVLLMDFLRSNADYAYTVEELAELMSANINLPTAEILSALSSLVNRGRVETKVIGGMVYYIYSRVMGFRAH